MSLISLIEKKLETLSPASFQKLSDAYLDRFRDWPLQSWGTMIGEDKDKIGVPDAYCQLPDGRFVLVAYTTANKGLLKKLEGDLADCITRTKDMIAPAQVERICLVFNRKVSPENSVALLESAKAAGYKLELINIDVLTRMVHKYPPLAAELISLDLGRGQLLQGPEFIEAYGRQPGATSLNHSLYGRAQEQEELLLKLASANVVLVSGPAGVGKTQLVVTTCQAYCDSAPATRQLYYIYDKKSADFVKELRFMMAPGKEVLIVADDANRVSPYLTVLLAEQRVHPPGALKIIATVRDYAREFVKDLLKQASYAEEVELKPLAKEHITALLNAEPYNIFNSQYVSRILELSEGRPRLAIMVASVAKKKQTLSTLHSVADIYDSYFGPILTELEAKQNADLLRVAALIHFFRVVQQEDGLDEQINNVFGIAPDTFWECTRVLHDAELVEMHEDRIVRSSDQILGNFIFYKAFFGPKRLLAYDSLLLGFFSQWNRRVTDTITGVINDFDYEALKPRIKPALVAWFKQPDIEDKVRWQFYRTFWPYLRLEIISHAQEYLDALPWPEQPATAYVVHTSNNPPFVRESAVLEALESICKHPVEEQANAIMLVVELAAKLPEQFNKALTLLSTLCSFNTQEYNRYQPGLHTLTTTFEVLQTIADDPLQGAFARWLLQHITPSALATSFQGVHTTRGQNGISICCYEVPFFEDVKDWRQMLWMQFGALCKLDPTITVRMFEGYLAPKGGLWARHEGEYLQDWQRWDTQFTIPLLTSLLSPENFTHAKLVNRYYYWLERRLSIPEMQALKALFTSTAYRLYDLVVFDQPFVRRANRTFMRYYGDEGVKFLLERLAPFAYKKLASYKRLFEQLLQIYQTVDNREQAQIRASVHIILHEVIERQRSLGIEVLMHVMNTGNPFAALPWMALKHLASEEYHFGYQLVEKQEFQEQKAWIRLYLQHLSPELANDYWLNELYQLMKLGMTHYYFGNLTVYEPLTSNLYPELLTLALNYAEKAEHPVQIHYGFIEDYSQYFSSENLDSLKRLYAWQSRHQDYFDHEGVQLERIIKLDPDHLFTYVRGQTDQNAFPSRYESRKLHFLWQSGYYYQYLLQIIEELTVSYIRDEEEYIAKAFFPIPKDQSEKQHQEAFIAVALAHFQQNKKVLKLLFSIIREQMPDKLIDYLGQLLSLNDDADLLKKLRIFPSSRTAGSSWVPVHQQDQQVWESVLRLIETQPKRSASLLRYKSFVLQQISILEKQIDEEYARNFASPY
ncbi:MAG: ATP-binding protein [Hymenobacter sp.]|nr:MAG: ATP-binding protein [Hymenobacter sp.]